MEFIDKVTSFVVRYLWHPYFTFPFKTLVKKNKAQEHPHAHKKNRNETTALEISWRKPWFGDGALLFLVDLAIELFGIYMCAWLEVEGR